MFSELVDACVRVSGRPDCLIEITRMANEVMREISKRDDWPDDLVEERVERLVVLEVLVEQRLPAVSEEIGMKGTATSCG